MTQEHPITPPPELFAEWFADSLKTLDRKVSEDDRGTTGLIAGAVAIQAVRWGADQELEACCEWLKSTAHIGIDFELINARRPKPPSLKEQALQELERTVTLLMPVTGPNKVERLAIIRRALESLPEEQ